MTQIDYSHFFDHIPTLDNIHTTKDRFIKTLNEINNEDSTTIEKRFNILYYVVRIPEKGYRVVWIGEEK